MRDHVHLLLTPTDLPIERAIAFIKGGYSHRLHAPSTIWQRRYTARRILTREEFIARRIYINMEAVRAHLVARPEDYTHPSAVRPPTIPPPTNTQRARS